MFNSSRSQRDVEIFSSLYRIGVPMHNIHLKPEATSTNLIKNWLLLKSFRIVSKFSSGLKCTLVKNALV